MIYTEQNLCSFCCNGQVFLTWTHNKCTDQNDNETYLKSIGLIWIHIKSDDVQFSVFDSDFQSILNHTAQNSH